MSKWNGLIGYKNSSLQHFILGGICVKFSRYGINYRKKQMFFVWSHSDAWSLVAKTRPGQLWVKIFFRTVGSPLVKPVNSAEVKKSRSMICLIGCWGKGFKERSKAVERKWVFVIARHPSWPSFSLSVAPKLSELLWQRLFNWAWNCYQSHKNNRLTIGLRKQEAFFMTRGKLSHYEKTNQIAANSLTFKTQVRRR